MAKKLEGKKIALLVAPGFEQIELTSPKKALEKEGAETHIISTEKSNVKSFHKRKWGRNYKVDVPLEKAKAKEYDALVLPGGVINPDLLRREKKAVKFVKDFNKAKKPIAAICHGPWLLAEADVIKNKNVTSFMSIKTDLKNAGAKWLNRKVVEDGNLITSRHPGDLEAFNTRIIKRLSSK